MLVVGRYLGTTTRIHPFRRPLLPKRPTATLIGGIHLSSHDRCRYRPTLRLGVAIGRARHRRRSQKPTAEAATAEQRDLLMRRWSDALILCFFACHAQSLFALDCLVHTVAALYHEKCTISELQILLAVKPLESGGSILSDTEQDVLLSWSAIVMLTLQSMDVPHLSSASIEEIVGSNALNMKPFVDQILTLCRSGTTVESMMQIQEEAQNAAEGMTPSLRLMHLNSLLVALTASLARLLNEATEDRSDAQRFISAFDGGGRDRHGIALKSLIAFMGATQGSVFCIDLFVTSVTEGYETGLAAKELVDSITEFQYEQACRSLPIMDAKTQGVAGGISRQLFGRWVSIVYMTLAQSGQSHRLSTMSTGWGWAFDVTEDSHMFEMTNLSTFVTNSLRRVISEDEADASLDLSHRLKDVPDVLAYLPKYREEAEKQKVEEYGTSWVTVEDEEMQRTSPAVLAFWQMIFLVHLTYRKLVAAQEQHDTSVP